MEGFANFYSVINLSDEAIAIRDIHNAADQLEALIDSWESPNAFGNSMCTCISRLVFRMHGIGPGGGGISTGPNGTHQIHVQTIKPGDPSYDQAVVDSLRRIGNLMCKGGQIIFQTCWTARDPDFLQYFADHTGASVSGLTTDTGPDQSTIHEIAYIGSGAYWLYCQLYDFHPTPWVTRTPK